MQLNDLRSASGARCEKHRPGRGIGSGPGKTGDRGHKGLTSRSGGKVAPGFEGGQQPLHRCLPKLGFVSLKAMDHAEVRTPELAKVEGGVISLQILKDANLINQYVQRVKVMLSGEAGRAVTLKGIAATRGACVAIETTGGKFEDQMAKQGALSALSNGGLSELWARLRFLSLTIIVYRIGAYVPIPGINPDRLVVLPRQSEGTILSPFGMFSGGALERMSIFTLGIMPYIPALIIIQLMTAISPQLEQLKKEGEPGRRKISQCICYSTVVLALVQAIGISVGLGSQDVAFSNDLGLYFMAVITFVVGAMSMMWLGEQITERGVGNGISMLILASIVAGLSCAIGQSFESARRGDINIFVLIGVGLLAAAITAFVVFTECGQRRIAVYYAKRQ